jgi:hypothetical protein
VNAEGRCFADKKDNEQFGVPWFSAAEEHDARFTLGDEVLLNLLLILELLIDPLCCG